MNQLDSSSSTPTPSPDGAQELAALSVVVQALQPLVSEARTRVVAAASALLGMVEPRLQVQQASSGGSSRSEQATGARFSEDRTPTPKEFLFEKRPSTDVDRIACLAYYLTHYRDTPHFKTLDLSKLNTEAAQLKFSNAAFASENATKSGLLVPAGKGAKQLSAAGELYVQALPDRAAAKEAIAHVKLRRKGKKGSRSSSAREQESDE